MSKRSLARLSALQILYQNYFDVDAKIPPKEALARLRSMLDGLENKRFYITRDREHLERLLNGASTYRERLMQEVRVVLSSTWTLERLDYTSQVLLQLGAFELIFCLDIPKDVVLGEYTRLAHAFFDKPRVALINGVLDTLARKARPLAGAKEEIVSSSPL